MGLVGKQGPQKHSKIKKHTITIEVNVQIINKKKKENALSNKEKQTVNF